MRVDDCPAQIAVLPLTLITGRLMVVTTIDEDPTHPFASKPYTETVPPPNAMRVADSGDPLMTATDPPASQVKVTAPPAVTGTDDCAHTLITDGVIVITGTECVETATVRVPVQPSAFVPLTVYTDAAAGVTVKGFALPMPVHV